MMAAFTSRTSRTVHPKIIDFLPTSSDSLETASDGRTPEALPPILAMRSCAMLRTVSAWALSY